MLLFPLLLLCLVLVGSPARAANLESPAQGATLSGLGFISGWKCDAGNITVRINDGGHIPVATGQPRTDTRIACGTIHNGFITQMNWALLGDGQHTVVAYDDGVKFASATFYVGTLGEEFVRGAGEDVEWVLNDFPTRGRKTVIWWEESTQHFEVWGFDDEDLEPDPDPVQGQCGATRNTCQAGTANDGAVADTASHYRWRCDGAHGGRHSGTCQVAKPAPPDPHAAAKAALRKLRGTWRVFYGHPDAYDEWSFSGRMESAEDGSPVLLGTFDSLDRIDEVAVFLTDRSDYAYMALYFDIHEDDYGNTCEAIFLNLISPTRLSGRAYGAVLYDDLTCGPLQGQGLPVTGEQIRAYQGAALPLQDDAGAGIVVGVMDDDLAPLGGAPRE